MILSGAFKKIHPGALVLASFLSLIGIGTLLLMLPFSTVQGSINVLDALFTAVSAVCVTGLIVVDTGSFYTLFGQLVILMLIQLGGIGVMTLSVTMYRWMRRSVSFRQRKVMQDLFSHTPRDDIYRVVISVVKFTFLIEFLGALLLSLFWSRYMPFRNALYTGLFHAVSAFCNAGFSLFSDSLMQYNSSISINSVMSLLIIFGGLGFPVLYEIEQILTGKNGPKVSIQTRTVLTTSILLIFGGALLFSLLEFSFADPAFSFRKSILGAIFQSVTARTAGFNTMDIAALSDAGLALMLFLMFVGASPGSCGGGIKTTALAILIASSWSRIKGNKRVSMYKKSIPDDTVGRSLILIVLAIAVIGLVFFLLLATNGRSSAAVIAERGSFLPYLFETVSAFGTVGLSMGVTPLLNSWGKIFIILIMIVGRVGVLTFSYIITSTSATNGIEYSEENIMIG